MLSFVVFCHFLNCGYSGILTFSRLYVKNIRNLFLTYVYIFGIIRAQHIYDWFEVNQSPSIRMAIWLRVKDMKVKTNKYKVNNVTAIIGPNFHNRRGPSKMNIIDFNIMVAVVTEESHITSMGILASMKWSDGAEWCSLILPDKNRRWSHIFDSYSIFKGSSEKKDWTRKNGWYILAILWK